MKMRFFLLLGCLVLGQATAQELLCPETGIPMSRDPGCMTPNYNNPQPVPQAPAGEWQTRWGAIGGNAPKGILGVSTGMPTEQAAIQAALADCRARGGGSGCKSDLTYYNQCAVLVTGDKLYNTSSAATIEEAAARGIATCQKTDKNCRVYYSGCSPAQWVQY